ncbi:MAG: phage tail protein, partial [Plesiomonas sp.]
QIKQLVIDIIDIAVPVGIPFPWPLAELPPSKYGITFGKCNGAVFSETQYPKLAKIFPNLRVPDLRADFIRALDDGRGVDIGRLILSHQNDAIPNITGFISGSGMSFDQANGAFRLGNLTTGRSSSSTTPSGLSDDLDFDISKVVRTGPEVTVKNSAFLMIMRYS